MMDGILILHLLATHSASPEYLLRGTGPMFRPTDEDHALAPIAASLLDFAGYLVDRSGAA